MSLSSPFCHVERKITKGVSYAARFVSMTLFRNDGAGDAPVWLSREQKVAPLLEASARVNVKSSRARDKFV